MEESNVGIWSKNWVTKKVEKGNKKNCRATKKREMTTTEQEKREEEHKKRGKWMMMTKRRMKKRRKRGRQKEEERKDDRTKKRKELKSIGRKGKQNRKIRHMEKDKWGLKRKKVRMK